MTSKVWDIITYLVPNFHSAVLWMGVIPPHVFGGNLIAYSYCYENYLILVKITPEISRDTLSDRTAQ